MACLFLVGLEGPTLKRSMVRTAPWILICILDLHTLLLLLGSNGVCRPKNADQRSVQALSPRTLLSGNQRARLRARPELSPLHQKDLMVLGLAIVFTIFFTIVSAFGQGHCTEKPQSARDLPRVYPELGSFFSCRCCFGETAPTPALL